MYTYSFIIPHRNIPDLLNRCLESIPVREDVQVIVVDDNSDIDKKPSVSRPDTEIISLGPDSSNGAGRARNCGLKIARGKWCLFADADDFFVEGILDILDQYQDVAADVVYFNYKRCENNDTSVICDGNNDRLFDFCQKKKDYRYFRICFSSPWAKMFKNSLIQNNAINFQELKANNDTYFVVRAGLLADRIIAVNKCVYWYVIREGSIAYHSNVESLSKVVDRAKAHESVQSLLSANGIRTKFYLPTLVSLSLIKHDFTSSSRLCKEAGLRVTRFYYDAARIFLLRLFGVKSFRGPENYVLSKCHIARDCD